VKPATLPFPSSTFALNVREAEKKQIIPVPHPKTTTRAFSIIVAHNSVRESPPTPFLRVTQNGGNLTLYARTNILLVQNLLLVWDL